MTVMKPWVSRETKIRAGPPSNEFGHLGLQAKAESMGFEAATRRIRGMHIDATFWGEMIETRDAA